MMKFKVKQKNHLNWCFGQFYHSKIEVLQNCSLFFCASVSLLRGNFRELRRFLLQKTQARVTLLKKYILTYPIRIPKSYILESHDEKLEVLYEKDDFDRISIHTT